jgi:hypothetical protein
MQEKRKKKKKEKKGLHSSSSHSKFADILVSKGLEFGFSELSWILVPQNRVLICATV